MTNLEHSDCFPSPLRPFSPLIGEDASKRHTFSLFRFDLDEERPTIAGMVDERPDIVQKIEAFTSNDKWRRLETRDEAANVNSWTNNANREKRHDSDDDYASPTRKRAKSDDEDASPPRGARGRHDSDSNGGGSKDKTNGIGRRRRHDSDSDGGNDSDNSPPRKKGKSDDDDDNSPPRRKVDDSDNSPVRRRNEDGDSDNSPPKNRNASGDRDNSPVRRRKGSESDNSPRRRGGGADEASNIKATHTSRGLKAGLQSAKDMRKENGKIKRKEDKVCTFCRLVFGLSCMSVASTCQM